MNSSAEPGAVLDSSALIAHLRGEPGEDVVTRWLEGGCAISTVNLAEVFTKLRLKGMGTAEIEPVLSPYGLTVFPFTRDDALLAGELAPATRAWGLSLGDRACLALGCRLGLPVVTADRAWTRLKLPCKVKVLR